MELSQLCSVYLELGPCLGLAAIELAQLCSEDLELGPCFGMRLLLGCVLESDLVAGLDPLISVGGFFLLVLSTASGLVALPDGMGRYVLALGQQL